MKGHIYSTLPELDIFICTSTAKEMFDSKDNLLETGWLELCANCQENPRKFRENPGNAQASFWKSGKCSRKLLENLENAQIILILLNLTKTDFRKKVG